MYADDHQFYKIDKSVSTIHTKLQDCALKATTWYDLNFLRGNFKKYGTMLLSRNKGENEIEIEVNGTQIKPYHSTVSRKMWSSGGQWGRPMSNDGHLVAETEVS